MTIGMRIRYRESTHPINNNYIRFQVKLSQNFGFFARGTTTAGGVMGFQATGQWGVEGSDAVWMRRRQAGLQTPFVVVLRRSSATALMWNEERNGNYLSVLCRR